MENIKVENMMSNSGNYIANQFIIRTDKGVYFQSYDSIIAFKDYDTGKITLGTNWNYSKTTGKYRNEFLRETISETREKINNGTYAINPKW